MVAVIQRVSEASVSVAGEICGTISRGLLILLGIHQSDTEQDVALLSRKIAGIRIFADQAGLMNLSLADINGGVLVVSQFTLHADTRKGNRPSFIHAARPEQAIPLYENFLRQLRSLQEGRPVAAGIFGADMQVQLINDGPVTIIIDTQKDKG